MSVLPAPGASRAVLVGTSHYQHLEQLPAVSNNLRALKELLSSPLSLQLPAQHVTVVENPDAALTVVREVRQAAAEATDTLVVYFAGHGLIDPQDTLSLALPYTEFGRVETGLPYEWLRQVLLLDSNAKRHVVILDCCYSGLALGRMSASPGLADQAAVEGSFLLAAAAETRTALAPVGDTYTAFTGTLLETLNHGIPGGPELLDLGTIYRHLHRTLTARGHPVPQARDRNSGAQVALGRNHATLPASQAAAPPGAEATRLPWPDASSIHTRSDSVPAPQTQPREQSHFLKAADGRLAEETDAESPLDNTPISADAVDHSGMKPGGVRVRIDPPQPVAVGHTRAPEPAADRRKANSKKFGRKRTLVWTGGVLAFLLVGGSTVGYLIYQNVDGSITTASTDGAGTGGFSKDRAINVLVIGTDKRAGKGNESYGNADTSILFHVSEDRTNATALSIPSNLITDIPDCPTTLASGKKNIPGTSGGQFGTSLGQAERTPSCTMRTVTELTGIQLDHFMVADFNAVKALTTAIGGVDICLAKDINDKESHLKLSKGEHTIQGEQALALLRTRLSAGSGRDLSFIEIQQLLLGSLMRKLKSNDTLTSPTTMRELAEAAAKALTVDNQIGDINQLRKLGTELFSVNPKNITFTTVPVDKSKAVQVFSMLRKDVSFTGTKEASEEEPKLKGKMAAAADVRVDVYNGGSGPGNAQTVVTWLQDNMGVLKSTNKVNAPAKVEKTQLVYAPNQAAQARRLANMMGLPATAMKPTTDAVGPDPMVLTLGPDFTEAGTPLKPPADIQQVQADKAVCVQ
ncbi:LCP family protein [Streptomyces sp. NPDC057638]|uniref:caspase, EACC1-associated type n=1 Tax=Streptomyces sp. NPDC057638 TaxID=3346190 RepID=UPI0036BB1CA0